ncbi:shufflon system plasmid conjugative transfer pilus tip adhesin PilV [Burkholderia cenocepacia]|uniref:shufflon system plasmid conjugative transfer pilus tip adhesin PilV n=1 Tax=Burkholderia cenocepacia TaxID=95486 RepID=UPI00264F3672|nr:shufflon system plasmid conjugative transfer pilus tip adhesin PilV [Burkholderia cenocepacia]MDN7631016.1 shufflon system plasmid conjugative transfer pilus tip adhesin PilV [Burkholderia cenocepacia]
MGIEEGKMNRAQPGMASLSRQRGVGGIARQDRPLGPSRQRGVISLEAVVVMGVLLVAMAGVGTWIKADADRKDNQNAADNLNTVFQQALTWFNQNYATVQAAANPTATYPWATFMGGTTTVSQTNVYGQQYSLRFYKEPSGQIDLMVVTTGGSTIGEGDLRSISKMIGGAGGYVSSLTPANATGAMAGWNAALANFGGSPGGGHLAAAGFFQNASAVSNYLSRVVVPGNPQANQMETAIDMNGNDLNNARTVNAQKVVTPAGNGVQVGSTFYYGDGSNSAVRQNGALYVQNAAGTAAADVNVNNMNAAGSANASLDVVAGRNIWASNGAVTAAWLHSTGNLQIDGSAQVNGPTNVNGTVTSGGRLYANEYLQVSGWAPLGGGCGPNGLVANSGNGLLSCENGVWTSGAQFNPKIYTTASGNSGTIGPYNWCFLMDTTVTDSSAFGTSGVTLVADYGPGNRYFNAYNSHGGVTNAITYACF